jgi:putative modified peptide
MSQNNVERLIGRLVTDEAFRDRFAKDPEAAMQALVDQGIELTVYERYSLRCVNLRALEAFANTINPCLQKSDLRGGIR